MQDDAISTRDEWRPRPHDHLVEPVLAGLGEPAERSAEERTAPPGILRRVLAALATLVRGRNATT